MKHFALITLVFGHGLTQLGLTVPDVTWRPWMLAHSPHSVAGCTILLFTARLAIDLGICLWIIGFHRVKVGLLFSKIFKTTSTQAGG